MISKDPTTTAVKDSGNNINQLTSSPSSGQETLTVNKINGTCTSTSVFSLAYLRHVGPTSLQYKILFDVGNGITQKLCCGYRLHPHHALLSCLEFCLGRTLYMCMTCNSNSHKVDFKSSDVFGGEFFLQVSIRLLLLVPTGVAVHLTQRIQSQPRAIHTHCRVYTLVVLHCVGVSKAPPLVYIA